MLMFNSVRSGKGTVKKVASTISFGWMVSLAQYAISMILSAPILIPLFHVDPLFSAIVEEGWLGGHGTAGGMAQVFEELGWADGASLSITSAEGHHCPGTGYESGRTGSGHQPGTHASSWNGSLC